MNDVLVLAHLTSGDIRILTKSHLISTRDPAETAYDKLRLDCLRQYPLHKMAHQAHNIPWSLLASNLYWTTKFRGAYSITNLRPKMEPNQGKELTYFIKAFIRTIEEHSVCERNKYPATYDPADPADIILDPVTVQKITPTVRRWRSYGCDRGRCPNGVCRVARYKEECQCIPIPDEEKRASAFLRPSGQRHCYDFFDMNAEAFFNVEVVKTLLLYGEMHTILRACALPGVCLKQWWCDRECQCSVSLPGKDASLVLGSDMFVLSRRFGILLTVDPIY